MPALVLSSTARLIRFCFLQPADQQHSGCTIEMTSRTVLLCFVTTQPSHSPLGSAVPQELSAGATCEDDELASLSVSRNPSQLSRNNSAYSVPRNPSQLSRNDSSPAMSRNSSRSNQRSDNDELQFSEWRRA